MRETWLRSAYVTQRKSMKSIARECGVSVTTILYYMRKFGIERRMPGIRAVVNGSVGKQFDRWTLLEMVRQPSKLGSERWLAKCHCGTVREIDIRTGGPRRSKSCGHCFKPVYPKVKRGDRFGDWVFLKYVGAGKWLARCKCGKKSNVSLNAVRRGRSNSCRECNGIKRRGTHNAPMPITTTKECLVCHKSFLSRSGDQYHFCNTKCRAASYVSSLSAPLKRIRYLAASAIRRAKKLGLPFDKDLPIILTASTAVICACCRVGLNYTTGNGRGGRNIRCPSIDRILPAKGYIAGNVAIICFRCNALKNNASRKELQDILRYIDKHVGKPKVKK